MLYQLSYARMRIKSTKKSLLGMHSEPSGHLKAQENQILIGEVKKSRIVVAGGFEPS